MTSCTDKRTGRHCVLQDVINGSDHQAVLQLMNLVAGSYIFTLTITDTQGLTSSDMVHLLVKNG